MNFKDTLFSIKQTINCGGTVIDLSKPKIMGILNITPDSFYDGGRTQTEEAIQLQVSRMIGEGADIIDIGGYSSRPGAANVSSTEEKQRVKKALKIIRRNFPGHLLSIDTFRPDIARFAIEEFGVNIINDISSGLIDDNMLVTAAKLKVPYVMMHMKGTPADMQLDPRYEDVVKELIVFFSGRISKAREAGIKDIIVDPGFGFGKTVNHNYTLLHHLNLFGILNCPVAIGLSRKSLVYKPLNLTPDDALTGTTALHVLALLNGAGILRVHDVKEAVSIVRLLDLYRNAGN